MVCLEGDRVLTIFFIREGSLLKVQRERKIQLVNTRMNTLKENNPGKENPRFKKKGEGQIPEKVTAREKEKREKILFVRAEKKIF